MYNLTYSRPSIKEGMQSFDARYINQIKIDSCLVQSNICTEFLADVAKIP